MTYDQIIKELKSKTYRPVYFLSGEEPYFIDAISDFVAEHVLSDSEKEFNQTILYGRDVSVGEIIENAKRFPMMSSHQVLIIKEAQEIKNIENLEPYVKQPLDSTILVICYKHKKLDKRKKLAVALKKQVFFESKRIYDSKMPDWVNTWLSSREYKIHPRAAALLIEHLGTSLSKIVNELEKLIISIPKGTEISLTHIQDNIGISKDFNVFELHGALGKKDVLKANQIIYYFSKDPKNHSIFLTLGALYSYFTKILLYHYAANKSPQNLASTLGVNPYFVRDYQVAAKNYSIKKCVEIIGLLREYDLKAKGIDNASTSEGELQKEMVYRILH